MKGNGTAQQQRSHPALHAVLVARTAKVLSFPLDEESVVIIGLYWPLLVRIDPQR